MGTTASGGLSFLLFILIFFTIVSVSTIVFYSYDVEIDIGGEQTISFGSELSRREIQRKIDTCDDENTLEQQRDWCYLNLAREHRIDACDLIISSDHARFCVSVVNLDIEKCDSIGSAQLRDSCVMTLAKIFDDESLCEDVSRTEHCLSQFS